MYNEGGLSCQCLINVQGDAPCIARLCATFVCDLGGEAQKSQVFWAVFFVIWGTGLGIPIACKLGHRPRVSSAAADWEWCGVWGPELLRSNLRRAPSAQDAGILLPSKSQHRAF